MNWDWKIAIRRGLKGAVAALVAAMTLGVVEPAELTRWAVSGFFLGVLADEEVYQTWLANQKGKSLD